MVVIILIIIRIHPSFMVEKMKAMVLSSLGPIENHPLRLKSITKHRLQNTNDMLVRIEACGVCRSQLHGIEGDWKKYNIPPKLPTIPGHEIVGEVIESGRDVSKFKIGQKVGISPLHNSCMHCIYCMSGKEHLCESADITGESLMGGYAEYITVNEDFATLVPNKISSEQAAPLFCAGITAYRAVKATEPKPNTLLGIFGVGGVGHMAIQFAIINKCKVVAVTRNKTHINTAKKLSAHNTIQYKSQHSFIQQLKNSVGLLDNAIVFAPSSRIVDTAIKSVKRGGTITIGTFVNIPNFNAAEEKTIRGTLIGNRNDMKDVIKIAETGKITTMVEKYPLEQANEVLLKLKKSQIKARAVLIPNYI